METLTGGHGAQVVVDEETGEVEIIDLGDPLLNEEVEVVTVESAEGELTPKMMQVIRSPTAVSANRRKSSNSALISISSPASQSHQGSGSGPSHRISTKPPALLRNSRRFQTHDVEVAGSSASALYLNQRGLGVGAGVTNSFQYPNISTTFFSRGAGGSVSLARSIADENQEQSMMLHHQEFQEAVILDENGQPTEEIVYLASNESGELQVVERANRDLVAQSEEYSSSAPMSPEKGDISSYQHQGQTIIICQDPETNQESQFLEDEEGNLISIDNSSMTYQVNAVFSMDNEEGTVDECNESVASLRLSKVKKKMKKPLQVIIGPDGKPLKKKGQTELQCMEKGCPTICYNVFELRKHLMVTHSILFDEEIVTFPSDKAFKEWRENYERERMVSFIYRGGTKKIAKDQAVTYLICHRSGHYKPTMGDESLRKRKMKPQGSCKMGGYCTAGIKLLKNLESGSVRMEICHTHYGHPLDSDALPHLRVNPALRKVILNKFREGLSFTEVLAYLHHNPDRLEGLRLVDRRAVRNIFDAWKNPSRRSKKAQQDIDEITMSQDFSDGEAPLTDTENAEVQLGDTETVGGNPSSSPDVSPISGNQPSVNECVLSGDDVIPMISSIQKSPELISSSISTETVTPTPCGGEDSAIAQPDSMLILKTEKSSDKSVDANKEVEEYKNKTGYIKREDLHMEEDDSPPVKGAYRLRPNRRVEVYAKKRKLAENFRLTAKHQSQSASNRKSDVESPDKAPSHRSDMTPSKRQDPEPVKFNARLEASIDKLHNHGESGPTVLFYKKYGKIAPTIGTSNKELKREDFCVVLQSPVQRQLLQMFPSIVGLEILDSPRPDSPLKLAFLIVLDEYREAIPVAWLVCNSCLPRIFHNLFRVIKDQCGDLRTEFLMASASSGVFKLWCNTFEKKPKLLLNDADFKRDLKALISHNLGNDRMRREMWDLVETLINEKRIKEVEKFIGKTGEAYKQYSEITSTFLPFKKIFESQWLDTVRQWALCYRINTPVNVIGVFNAFNRLKKFVGFKGTKNLNESFEHILKIGYDKCFLRSKRMFKGDQKFSQFMEDIKMRHDQSRVLRRCSEVRREEGEANITVIVEDKEFTVTDAGSKCGCKLVCKHCSVCVHAYLCCCRDYLSTQVMCEHIHLAHVCTQGIIDDPEVITGDISVTADSAEDGVFGKVQTVGSGEGPGQFINIDAVLKAAGLFHRADGLQPEQIVSITDADTQDVLYEQHRPGTDPESNPLDPAASQEGVPTQMEMDAATAGEVEYTTGSLSPIPFLDSDAQSSKEDKTSETNSQTESQSLIVTESSQDLDTHEGPETNAVSLPDASNSNETPLSAQALPFEYTQDTGNDNIEDSSHSTAPEETQSYKSSAGPVDILSEAVALITSTSAQDPEESSQSEQQQQRVRRSTRKAPVFPESTVKEPSRRNPLTSLRKRKPQVSETSEPKRKSRNKR